MSFFDKFRNPKTDVYNGTTKGLFLGAPEAEAETLNNSAMVLTEVFIEDSNIFNDLAHEKFIIVGRKGSGKSAIANFIMLSAQNESNVFSDFVKRTDIFLQKAVQVSEEQHLTMDTSILFQWIFLYKMIVLLIKNARLSSQKYINELEKFVSQNDSFSVLDQYKITDFITQSNCEIDITPLKDFLKIKGNNSLKMARKKLPFYEMIPHLKTVVKSLLWTINQYKDETEYIIFFDDLDNDFKSSESSCKENLLSLIRIVKELNAEFSCYDYVKTKIILLLRDDIKNILLANADVAKIFASYTTSITWYSDELYKKDPNEIAIKKFIDKRINYAFKQLGQSKQNCPTICNWEGFVKVSFKDVLDYTFYTPRDLLLFFKPITENEYTIPLTKNSIEDLFNKYCDAVIDEIKSMLSIFYTYDEINEILNILEDYLLSNDESYENLRNALNANNRGSDTMDILLNASIVGWRDYDSRYVYFKHREKSGEDIPYVLQGNYRITLHRAIKNYFMHHRNRPR